MIRILMLAISLLLATGTVQAQAADSRLKKIASTKTITTTSTAYNKIFNN